MSIRHLDLFAGIGGFSLAVEWLGGETVAFVEWESWNRRVLAKNRAVTVISRYNSYIQHIAPGDVGSIPRADMEGQAPMPLNDTPCPKTANIPAEKRRVPWVVKTCPECGDAFERPPYLAGQTYCSPRCRAKATMPSSEYHAQHVAARVEWSCERCGKVQRTAPSIAAKRRFCSRKCQYTTMRGDNAANAGGGEWMRGERNPNWKGGVPVDERTRQPYSAELSQWRRRVFQRDRYTCQRCGLYPKTGRQLQAHHVAPWSQNVERRFDVDNGLTLCRSCHAWVHSKENVNGAYIEGGGE